MKSIKLTLIFCLFSSSLTFGQNYQTVVSNRISYFEGPYRSIECIRIDSVKFQTDSAIYPFSNIRQTEDGCFTPFGDSWIGAKIIKKENGLNIFFNRDHDSIQIKTNAILNDSWTVYYLPDSIKIIATVFSHDTMSFIGQLDSVKSIGFQVYDKNMNLLDYPLNNMELKISKNFGFVKTFNFYLFPNLTDYTSESLEEYSLIGLSNPETGIRNLTWFEIYDFKPGDELHIVKESRSLFEYLMSDKIIRKYLSRSDYNDSIVYTYSQKESYYLYSPDTSYLNYTNSTGKEIIRSNRGMDMLPGEPVLEGDTSEIFYNTMENGLNLSKIHARDEAFYRSNASCWEQIILTGDCFTGLKYLKGLGGPYFECNEVSGSVARLVYYKKGDVSWGTPLVITGVQDRLDEENILVFPNPAHNNITIRINKFEKSEIFEIFDITGRIIVQKNIVLQESNIGIEDLKPGTYVYRLREDNKIVKMDKLIIK